MWQPAETDTSMLPEGVEAVHYQLPMTFDFSGSKFYVRNCYEEYYRHVMQSLSDPTNDYVSLTGSPGIGKSIFYLYFFQRFKN